MSQIAARYAFALMCAVGMLVIGMGAVLELVRFRRNARQVVSSTVPDAKIGAGTASEGIVSPRQFRLRIFSAFIWMVVLGTFCYALTVLWPEGGRTPQAATQARHFVQAIGVAVTLIFVALLLLLYDVILLAQARREQTVRFYRGLADMARAETGHLSESANQRIAKDITEMPSNAASHNVETHNTALRYTDKPTDEIAGKGSS